MCDHDESIVCTQALSAEQVSAAVQDLLTGMCSLEALWFEVHLSDCLKCCLAVAEGLDVNFDASDPGLIGMVLSALNVFQQATGQGSAGPLTDFLNEQKD